MRLIVYTLLGGLSFLLYGCSSSTLALGDATSVVVIAPDSVWDAVEDSVRAVLESRVYTVRDERMFDLTHVAPTDPDWGRLRVWKQVLVIGRPDDPWVQPALPRTLPADGELIESQNVWARGQTVAVLTVPDEAAAADRTLEMLPELKEFFTRRYLEYVRSRMFTSGADTALRTMLRDEAGFSVLVPNIYEWRREGESIYRFANTNITGGRIDRSVLVTWRDGADRAPTVDELLDWRDEIARTLYPWEQVADRERIDSRALDGASAGSIEVNGAWTGTDPDFPMGGPFLSRAVVCPEQDRVYLIDAWLYAPSRGKYEYVLQLETILNSFDCES